MIVGKKKSKVFIVAGVTLATIAAAVGLTVYLGDSAYTAVQGGKVSDTRYYEARKLEDIKKPRMKGTCEVKKYALEAFGGYYLFELDSSQFKTGGAYIVRSGDTGRLDTYYFKDEDLEINYDSEATPELEVSKCYYSDSSVFYVKSGSVMIPMGGYPEYETSYSVTIPEEAYIYESARVHTASK